MVKYRVIAQFIGRVENNSDVSDKIKKTAYIEEDHFRVRKGYPISEVFILDVEKRLPEVERPVVLQCVFPVGVVRDFADEANKGDDKQNAPLGLCSLVIVVHLLLHVVSVFDEKEPNIAHWG